ncbi:hypothetical protein TKK_0000048 [Trichogramma kaykai]
MVPPPTVATIIKRIVESPLMSKDAPVPFLKEFSTGNQGDQKMIRLKGLNRAFVALQRTMECTEAPSSQEAMVAASTPSWTRKKRPATSPPEVTAAEKRATGPHLHEQVVDVNNNTAISEETFTVMKGRRGRCHDAHQAEEVERGLQPPRPDAIVVKAAGATTFNKTFI